METLTVECSNIECDACANAITKSLGRLSGVDAVTVDVAAKTVEVRYASGVLTVDSIRDRLAAAGFDPAPTNA